jgi:hypothetical protein
MKICKKIIIISFVLLNALNGNAQFVNEVKDQINKAILFGEVIDYPSNGINIIDTNAVVSLYFYYDQFNEVKKIYFDSIGRITCQITNYVHNKYIYKEKVIYKFSKYFYFDPLNKHDSTFTVYHFNSKGLVDKIEIKSLNNIVVFYCKYTWSSHSCSVDLVGENNKIKLTHVFIFNNDGSTFQWQIIRNDLIILRHKTQLNNKITTSIPHEINLKYWNIILLYNGNDSYKMLSSTGKEIGEVKIVREKY